MMNHDPRTGVKQLHWILDEAPLENDYEKHLEEYVINNSNIDKSVMIRILEHPEKYGINMYYGVVKHPRATKKVLGYAAQQDLGFRTLSQKRLEKD